MQIQHKEEDGKGIFYIEDNGNTVAELVYSIPSADKIIIEHTEVDHPLSGKGVGKQLVGATVDYSRSNNIKIIPLCSFAKSVFEEETEWQDVLYTFRKI
ncbi:MAG: N-acetyltransferase [Chitinophagaceae bacterium]|nr:N-acetyltransferase [Chitinophagaceae bacterium]